MRLLIFDWNSSIVRFSGSVMYIVLVHRTGYRQITIVADPTEIAENPGIIPTRL